MRDVVVEVEQHPRGGVVHDGGFDRLARKRTDRRERVPPRDDGDFDDLIPLHDVALEQRDASIAMKGGQLGQHRRPQERRIFGGAFGRRARFPDARDHGVAAPMTTFHGRTRQFLTRPLVTYGSPRAKRSATFALSARNTSSAPSGGSPSAPARIN